VSQGVVAQLSTYSAQGFSQQEAIAEASAGLKGSGLTLVADVRASGHMMSMVFSCNIRWTNVFGCLQSGFNSWLEKHRVAQSVP
jgi:hypothetical protein